MKFLSNAYWGFIWWVEDAIDWIDALVDKCFYQGVHRGVYDWDIGTGEAFWEKGLPKGWRIRFVNGEPCYAWEGLVHMPEHVNETAMLLIKPPEALTSIPALVD